MVKINIDKKTQLSFFRRWCMSCKRHQAHKKLHGDRHGGVFTCSDITCPAQRRTNKMELSSAMVTEYVKGSKLRLVNNNEEKDNG